MLERYGKIPRIRWTDPAVLVTSVIALLLICIFIWGFKYATTAATLLPTLAIALSISLLLVPQRNISVFLLILTGMSVPFAHFALVVVGGEGIQWMHLFGFLLIAHFIARLALGNSFQTAPSMIWLLGLVAASFISLLAITNMPEIHVVEFWKSEVQLLFGVFLYFAVTQVRVSNRQLIIFLQVMIGLSVLVALFGLYQLPARFYGLPWGILKLNNPSLSGQTQSIDVIFYLIRSSSLFSEPSYYGHYMNGMIATSLVCALHRPGIFFGKPLLLYVVLCIQIAGLIVSFAMSSLYILGIILLVMFLTENHPGKSRIVSALVGIVLLAGVVILLIKMLSDFDVGAFMADRIYGIYMYVTTGGDRSWLVGPESIYQRVDTSKIAMAVWWDHMLIGVGMGSYQLVSQLYGEYNPSGFSANALMNTLAEMGLVGFFALAGFAIASLYPLWAIFRRNNIGKDDDAGYRDAILLSRMAFFIVLVELLYFHIQGSFFWPSVWFNLGLGALVMIRVSKVKIPVQSGS